MLELFVTEIEPNSDKIYITAGLAATMQGLGYYTTVYKPVQTGAVENNGYLQSPDLVFVKLIDTYIQTYFSYLLKSNATPFVAAAEENMLIDKELILKDYESIIRSYECIITDGTSGINTPFAPNFAEKDFIKELNLPVVFVVKPTVSAVTSTLMTINHAQIEGLNIRGVIINDYNESDCPPEVKTMPELIKTYTDTEVLGKFNHIDNIQNANPNDLIANILSGIDIEKVFNVKIAKLNPDV